MNWCPNCGRQTEEGEKFCRNCGMPLDLTGEDASTWILSDSDRPTLNLPPQHLPQQNLPPRNLPPHTRPVNPNQTAQTGPTYLPPTDFYTPPQPPQYYPPVQQTGQSHIRLGDWLSGGWKLYSQNWLLMSVATFLSMILSFCTIGILAGPLLMGLYRMAFKSMRQERVEMNDLFNWKDQFWQAFLAFVIFALIHLGFSGASRGGALSGLIAFVISPFLVSVMGLTIPYMLERKVDVANAINDVGRMIFSRDAMMWWIVGLVFSAISAAGFAGCFIGGFVTVPWMISSSAVAYRDVFGFDDPNRTNQ
ncbi:MAG: zinc ribbon domain-containing protein [Blastocatellia bacterium]